LYIWVWPPVSLILRDLPTWSFVIFFSTSSWAVVLNSFLSCSTHYFLVCCHSRFECIVTRVIDRLDSPFLCKGSSSTSVKTLFNISAQPQLLKIEGPGDVGIVKVELCYILCFYLIFSFLTFVWLLYSCENWIDLNYIPLPLHLNIKPQIGLYISILGSLYSCTIFDL
jgi:hypothetical protein